MRNSDYKVISKLGELFDENSFLCIHKETKATLIIDPATMDLMADIEREELKPVAIFLTHVHVDHILYVDAYAKKYEIPLYVHENERHKLLDPATNLSAQVGAEVIVETPCVVLKGQSGKVDFGTFKVTYELFAGHSEGNISIGIEHEHFYFVGDSVFATSIGRYDLLGSNGRRHHESLTRMAKYPEETWLYPGHARRFQVKELEKNLVYQQFINLGV